MTTTFDVKIDWDGDGIGAGDSIQAYVQRVDISLGITDPFSHVAGVGRCAVVVDNTDRRFSPAYTSGPLYGKLVPNLLMRVTATDGAESWTLFEGVTRSFEPSAGEHGAQEAAIICVDRIGVLQNASISLPLQEGIRTSALIKLITSAVFNEGVAAGEVRFNRTPSDGDTVTIGEDTYTFKTALTPTAGEVLIGDDRRDSTANLRQAINNAYGEGTKYAEGTGRSTVVSAALGREGTEHPDGYQDKDVDLRRSEVPVKYRLAQAFQVPLNQTVPGEIWLYLKKTGSPTGTLTLKVETDSGGTPSGAKVHDNAEAARAESSLGTSYEWEKFSFETFSLTGETTYWLVLYTDRAVSASDYTSWGADDSAGYPSAGMWYWAAAACWQELEDDAIFSIPQVLDLKALAWGAWGNDITLSDTGSAITTAGLSGGVDGPDGKLSVQIGTRILEHAADNWGGGRPVNALAAIADVAASEWGFFWQDRSGALTFKNIDWEFVQCATSPALSLTAESPSDLSGRSSVDDVYNQVVVSHAPRATLSTGVVAQVYDAIKVPPNSGTARWNGTDGYPAAGDVLRRAPYTDPETGQAMGAKNVQRPAASTDYTVNTERDGSGTDYTSEAYVSTSVVIGGSKAEISLANSHSKPLWVRDLQVRGEGITRHDLQEAVQEDGDSVAAYGRRAVSIHLPFPSGQDLPEPLAAYLLACYKTPIYRVTAIHFDGPVVIGSTNLCSLALGDVAAVTDGQLGLADERLLIVGMRTAIEAEKDFRLTLHVRTLADKQYWVLGDATYSKLGDTSRLGI